MLNNQTLWKTLTVYQPWATMIALGHKTIETRNHAAYKWLAGQQLAIHAGKRYERDAFEYLIDRGFNPLQSLLLESAVPRGAIVAVCRVSDTCSECGAPTFGTRLICKNCIARWLTVGDMDAACSDTDTSTFGLVLEDVRALIEPVPVRGSQGVWGWRPPQGWTIETHTKPPPATEATENTEAGSTKESETRETE